MTRLRESQAILPRPAELLFKDACAGAAMKLKLEKPDDMQDLMTRIARALVDIPEGVFIDAEEARESTVLNLRVAPNEVGKVIGKQGRLAQSMRTILGAVGMKHQHRYTLHIVEEYDRAMAPDERGEEVFS